MTKDKGPIQAELELLDARINALLPPRYQHCYEDVRPTSMGSAGLKFGPDGKVAWNEIWTSFCDLALAGGPPHRGSLLQPAGIDETRADPERYQAVVEEIGRGIYLVTGLRVLPRLAPGWVGVLCADEAMAVWMLRAVVAENILARHQQHILQVPAGPEYRLEKEVKNVVTSVAKTHHYWAYHMPGSRPAPPARLVQPPSAAEAVAEAARYQAVVRAIEEGVSTEGGVPTVASSSPGWVGVQCPDEEAAGWLLRAVLVEEVLARREENVLYVPAGPRFTADGDIRKVVAAVATAARLWRASRAR